MAFLGIMACCWLQLLSQLSYSLFEDKFRIGKTVDCLKISFMNLMRIEYLCAKTPMLRSNPRVYRYNQSALSVRMQILQHHDACPAPLLLCNFLSLART